MNYKHPIAISMLAVCCVGLIGLLLYRVNLSRTTQTLRPATEETSKPEVTPTPGSETVSLSVYKDLIEIIAPSPNSVISLASPMTKMEVNGKARGTWFFEASFPIELLNANGDSLAKGIAQADGEWMTSEYVPFRATLTFRTTIKQSGTTGTLLLKKDNPSGDPKNDDVFVVPVQFAP